MLERFPGKTGKSALPKNQIELTCPLCGSVQIEPRLVLTTFCRKCGEHLRIEKNGRVVASATLNPVPSSVYPAYPENISAEPATAEESAPPPVEPEAARASGGLPEDEGMLDLTEQDHQPHVAGIRRRARIGSPPAPTMASAPPQRMRDQGGSRQHYFKEIECFDCRNKFKVGRSARSASCPSCGGQICLEDVEINFNSTNSVRTRGDVLIHKNGNVQAAEVRCRDLKLFGVLSAAIECSGEMFVRATGTVIGEVRCHRLLIDKGCDVHFMNSIFAHEVEVRGRILGQVQCSGAVSIAATGHVQGDVKARAVSIEPGGQLDGAMNIVRVSVARELMWPLGPPPERPPAGGGL